MTSHYPAELLQTLDIQDTGIIHTYPFLDFYPTVIQTIGKAKKYQYQNKTPKQLKKDTRPPIDDIFNFVGSN